MDRGRCGAPFVARASWHACGEADENLLAQHARCKSSGHFPFGSHLNKAWRESFITTRQSIVHILDDPAQVCTNNGRSHVFQRDAVLRSSCLPARALPFGGSQSSWRRKPGISKLQPIRASVAGLSRQIAHVHTKQPAGHGNGVQW